jgi:hypothetical protein
MQESNAVSDCTIKDHATLSKDQRARGDPTHSLHIMTDKYQRSLSDVRSAHVS